MDLEEARAWMDSSEFEREMVAADNASDDALEEAEGVLSSLTMFRSSDTADLRRAITDHQRASQTLTTAIDAVVAGRARDARALVSAFSRFDDTLNTLEELAFRYGCLVRANVADAAAALSAAFISYQTRMRRRCRDLLPELRQLDAILHEFADDVEEARAQRFLNVAIAGVTAVTGPTGLGARIAFGAGVTGVQVLLDAALGPSGSSLSGGVVTAAGNASSLTQSFSNLAPPCISGITALLGFFTSDTPEIDDAERRLARLRRMLPSLRRDLATMERFMRSELADLTTAKALYEGALRTASRERSRFRSSAADRRSLARRFASIR